MKSKNHSERPCDTRLAGSREATSREHTHSDFHLKTTSSKGRQSAVTPVVSQIAEPDLLRLPMNKGLKVTDNVPPLTLRGNNASQRVSIQSGSKEKRDVSQGPLSWPATSTPSEGSQYEQDYGFCCLAFLKLITVQSSLTDCSLRY
ncbi:hypothetical protein EYF80_044165 [Liparis tanakae]|uniref:Uncharacterized protein n=1 Tax=Liparis tanakae TaxID=230148 RepID=A0A4Z2FXP7_9TELE|nr:hypothetical protein EYF80_044165 [Liparis tanakae]